MSMSEENVEIVKRVQPSGIDMVKLVRASNAPDPAVTPEATGIDVTVLADDMEVEFISGTAGSLRGTDRGPEAFVQAWAEWLEAFDSYEIETEELIDAGDEVVALVRVRAKTRRDAVVVEHRPAAVWSVRERKIVRVRFFLERERALEAAGLAE
jgi:ketosteroid isomerase-like protein